MGFRKVSNSRSELLSHLYNAFTFCLVKAKFHYAIQVADLVADLAFDKFMRVCDQLATFFESKAPAFDPKKSRAGRNPHELVGNLVGNRVCDQVCDLDSVMEFGLY